MKKMILFLGVMLVASAGIASAAGVSLHWNACTSGGGVQSQSFACDDDFAFFQAVGQFKMPATLNGVTGVEFGVDLATASPTLPPWWKFNVGECRAADGLAVTEGTPSALQCPDWAVNAASGGLAAYNEGFFGPNTAHILGGFAVPAAKARSLTTTPDYFVFNILLSSTGAVGPPVCDGCLVPACIVFNSVKVVTPPVIGQPDRSIVISDANVVGGNFITWQGGQGVSSPHGVGCPAATATHRSTWGSVKSLYR